MGMVIYVNGELSSDGLTDKQISFIEDIKDGWGEKAYFVLGDSIFYNSEQIGGCTPYEDGVITPLEKLIEYAKKENISIDGNLEVSSDWDDYDNIGIEVKNNEITHYNTEISGTTTDELVNELKRRGAHAHAEHPMDVVLCLGFIE